MKRKLILILCLLTIGLSQVFASFKTKNASQIQFRAGSKDEPNVKGLSTCSGKLPAGGDLSDIGLSPRDLESGVTCIVGDFDGNGYSDFVFLGKPKLEQAEAKAEFHGPATRAFKVVLFKSDKVIFSKRIETHGYDALELYPPQKNTGPFGEPRNKIDGLVQRGEGSTTHIFFFDKAQNDFTERRYASENE